MFYGMEYYYLDFMSFDNCVSEKIWVNDDCDTENMVMNNIYSTRKEAEDNQTYLLYGK